MAYSIGFWNRIAAGYARRPVSDQAAYEHKLAITQRYLRPDMKVLEFGCGTGSTALIHAPKVAEYRASDLSPKMIEIARQKQAGAAIENLRFEVSPLEELEVADGSQDVVLGLSILHLMQDPDGAIDKVHRMLKPGGLFFSSTACIADSMPWFGLIAPIGRWLGLMPAVKVFSQVALENSLNRAGFVVEERYKPEGKHTAVFLVARKSS